MRQIFVMLGWGLVWVSGVGLAAQAPDRILVVAPEDQGRVWAPGMLFQPLLLGDIPAGANAVQPPFRPGATQMRVPSAVVEVWGTAYDAGQQLRQVVRTEWHPQFQRAFAAGIASGVGSQILAEFMSTPLHHYGTPTVPSVFYNSMLPEAAKLEGLLTVGGTHWSLQLKTPPPPVRRR